MEARGHQGLAPPLETLIAENVGLLGRRVLVVDDNELVARACSRFFDLVGMVTELVSTLVQARERLESKEPPEVLLLDLCLGNERGSELLPLVARLKSRPAVVVWSAHLGDPSEISALQESGALILPKRGTGTPETEGAEEARRPESEEEAGFGGALLRTIALALRRREGRDRGHELVQEFAKVHRLSSRELAVLLAAVSGMHDDLIAERFQCAPATVRTHWRRIFDKAKVSGGRNALLAAILRGTALYPKRGHVQIEDPEHSAVTVNPSRR